MSGRYRTPVAILDRYDAMCATVAVEPCCEEDPGTSYAHLRWMLMQLRSPMTKGKANRWLGFVQGLLIERGHTTVRAERAFTRPLLKDLG